MGKVTVITDDRWLYEFKIGSYFRKLSSNKDREHFYIMAEVEDKLYCLIDLETGNRYNDPQSRERIVAEIHEDDFELVNRDRIIQLQNE